MYYIIFVKRFFIWRCVKLELFLVCFIVYLDLDNCVYIFNNWYIYGYIYMYIELVNIKWNLFNKRIKYLNFLGDGIMMYFKGFVSV